MGRIYASVLTLIVLLSAGPAQADLFVPILNPALFQTTDNVDWSHFDGMASTDGGSVPSPFETNTTFTNDPVRVRDTPVFNPDNPTPKIADSFATYVAGGPNFPDGGFHPGEWILDNVGTGDVQIHFLNKPVAGAGAQFDFALPGTAYTMTLTALDQNLNPFPGGTVTTSGVSPPVIAGQGQIGNSPFLGIKGDHIDIFAVRFSLTMANTGSPEYLLGQLAVNVPEPGSLSLAGLAVVGFAGSLWRRRRSRQA